MSDKTQTLLQRLFEETQKKVAQDIRDQIGATVEINKNKPSSENYSFIPRVEVFQK
jgi:hypothetical protein